MNSGRSGEPQKANLNEFNKEINRKWAPGGPGGLKEQILMNLFKKSIGKWAPGGPGRLRQQILMNL